MFYLRTKCLVETLRKAAVRSSSSSSQQLSAPTSAGSFAICTIRKQRLSRLMKSNYSNIAQLKDLMTVPPMTAEQHAQVMRKRIQHRRMVEEAKELKKADAWQYDKR